MEAARGIGTEADEREIGRRYRDQGYELLYPAQVLDLERAELERVAAGTTEVLDEVYSRRQVLSAGRTGKLIEDVLARRVHLFALLDRARSVVAAMEFTRLDPLLADSPVVFYEAGGVAKRPGSPPLLATDLIRAGFVWAAARLEAHYVVAEARVAKYTDDMPYNGRMLARVLGHEIFRPAQGVYSHYVAQTEAEPFVWAIAALDPAGWEAGVAEQSIYLPRGTESELFAAMLAENHLSARVVYRPANGWPSLAGRIRKVLAPSRTDESLFVLTGEPDPAQGDLDDIPTVSRPGSEPSSAGLSDRLIVEEDVIAQPDAVNVLNALYQKGFDLVGWTPSSRRLDRLALVLTRPGSVSEEIRIAPPDLTALAHKPATHRFLEHALSRRPSPDVHEAEPAPVPG